MRTALLHNSAVVAQNLVRRHRKSAMLAHVHTCPVTAGMRKSMSYTQHICRYKSFQALSPGIRFFAHPSERVSSSCEMSTVRCAHHEGLLAAGEEE